MIDGKANRKIDIENRHEPMGMTKQKIIPYVGLPLVIIFLGGAVQIFRPDFLSASNLQNIVRQGGPLAFVAIGQAFVIIAGGLDISVGSIMGIVSVTAAISGLKWGLAAGILCGLAVGIICGTFNGVIVAWFRVPALIVTLGMLSIARGMALTVTDGMTMDVPTGFSYIGWANWGPFPVMALVVILVFLICFGILELTSFGRKIYATGANAEATRLSGISVAFHRFITFVLSGGLTALGAIILTSRMNSGNPLTGVGFELGSIGAVVIGGVYIRGGEGSLLGVLMGVVFFTALSNGLMLVGFSSYVRLMLEGVVFVLALCLNLLLYRQRD